MLVVVADNGGRIGSALVNINLFGVPLRLIAFAKKRLAAFWSRCLVSRKSMVLPNLSTARYKYTHSL